jgi:hypothetical protein
VWAGGAPGTRQPVSYLLTATSPPPGIGRIPNSDPAPLRIVRHYYTPQLYVHSVRTLVNLGGGGHRCYVWIYVDATMLCRPPTRPTTEASYGLRLFGAGARARASGPRAVKLGVFLQLNLPRTRSTGKSNTVIGRTLSTTVSCACAYRCEHREPSAGRCSF